MSDIQRIIDKLDCILPQFMQDEPVPGLSIGVVYHSQMIYAKGFGVKNIRTGKAVDELTLFHTASVSKTAVASAVMQLVEGGLIDLDAAITDYLPYFVLEDGRQGEITVRQLLNHTSGMPDEDQFDWEHPEYDEGSLERYVRSVRTRRLIHEPGDVFHYSNIGYELLGDMIAKVSGLPFETYMKDHILSPVSMLASTYLIQEVPSSELAAPHILSANEGYGPERSGVFPYHRAHGPSSTLYANAVEMCSYMIAHLNQGASITGELILSDRSYERMWGKHAVTDYGDWMNDMGLGWFMGDYAGYQIRSHMGRDTGFRSNMILLPEKGIGIAVMMNADYIGNKILCKAILNLLLGEEVPYVKRSLAHYLAQFTVNSGIEAAYREYVRITQQESARYLVLEDEFNAIAYTLMRSGNLQEGIRLLELSVRLFPESSNLHDSLAEMVLLLGERSLALQYYQKSVELDPQHTAGIKMVQELQASL